MVLLVLRERLSVTEVQEVAVDDADRHKVGEVDRLGVVVPVRDTVGLTDGHPDAVTDRLCVRVTAGDALALGHELAERVTGFWLVYQGWGSLAKAGLLLVAAGIFATRR